MYPIKWNKNNFILIIAYLAIVAISWFFSIDCVFTSLFNMPCPGCGMTRAVVHAMQFDFLEAAQSHPMIFAMPLGFLYIWQDGKVFKNKKLNTGVLILIGIGFIMNYAIKMAFLLF